MHRERERERERKSGKYISVYMYSFLRILGKLNCNFFSLNDKKKLSI